MAGCAKAFVAWHLALLFTAVSAFQHRDTTPVIPNTDIPIPANFSDYTRGRKTWPLFPSNQSVPGERHFSLSTCPGVPSFFPNHPEQSPETFIIASPLEPVNHRCSTDHKPVGHDIYNVWVPELLPYIVPLGTEVRTDAAVVIAPGGGSIFLAWDADGIFTAQWLNSIGVSAFVLKYRVPLATEEDQKLQVMDGHRALSLVRSRAAELGLNPDRIGFMGFSHGGHLAARMGASRQRTYQPMDAVDSLPFKPSFILMLYPGIPEEVLDLSAMPKTFVAFAEDDPCCPVATTRALVGELQRALPPGDVYAHEFPQGGHGWAACEWRPTVRHTEVCTWKSLAEAFLRSAVLSS